MKQIITRFLYLTFFVVLTKSNFAQDSTKTKKEKSHFEAGVKYLSRNVYLGRTDSAKISYISPTFGFFHKSGFHLIGSLSYMPNDAANRIDVSTIEAGYDFNLGKKFYGGLYADEFFYNTGSFAVNSEIHTGLGFYAGYDLNFITLNGGVGYSLGSQSDLITETGLGHSFFADKERLEIAPNFTMKSGTQNYYNAYFTSGRAKKAGIANSKGRGRGNNSGSGSGAVVTTTIVGSSQFKVLDYELSMPITYKIKNWKFLLTPTYAIPVNPATIENNMILTKESISNHLYQELEITFSF
jgi:hypothetical protein